VCVCLSVSLSVRVSVEPHVRSKPMSPNLWPRLPVVVAWSFFAAVATDYVLSVCGRLLCTGPPITGHIRRRRRRGKDVCSMWLNRGQHVTGGEVWCLRLSCLTLYNFLHLLIFISFCLTPWAKFGFYRAMLCIRGTSHGPGSVCLSVCLSVRPSVRHKSVFY